MIPTFTMEGLVNWKSTVVNFYGCEMCTDQQNKQTWCWSMKVIHNKTKSCIILSMNSVLKNNKDMDLTLHRLQDMSVRISVWEKWLNINHHYWSDAQAIYGVMWWKKISFFVVFQSSSTSINTLRLFLAVVGGAPAGPGWTVVDAGGGGGGQVVVGPRRREGRSGRDRLL